MNLSVEDYEIYDQAVFNERIKSTFRQLGYPQLDGVNCQLSNRTVRLWGYVSSYYLKQVVQTVAMKCSGVCDVINDIEVRTSHEV